MFHNSFVLLKTFIGPLIATFGFVALLASPATRDLANPMVAEIAGMVLFAFFPTLPSAVAVSLSSGTIVGEKFSRTLEPLLAAPVTTGELLIAKMVAVVIPVLLEFWICYGVLVVGTRGLGLWGDMLASRVWFVAVIVVMPMLTLVAQNIIVMVSACSIEPRRAQKRAIESISAVSLLFAIAILVSRFKLGWTIDSAFMLQLSAFLFLLNCALFALNLRIFRRESILSRWS
jgi:ABC-2 type transport system permease protein